MHPFKRNMLWAAERKGLGWIDVGQIVEAALWVDTPACIELRRAAPSFALPPAPDEYEPFRDAVFTVEARSFFERAAGRLEDATLETEPAEVLLAEAAGFDLGREALAALGLEPARVRRVLGLDA